MKYTNVKNEIIEVVCENMRDLTNNTKSGRVF